MAKSKEPGTVEFTEEVKHGTGDKFHRFSRSQVVAFEDPDAADYFVKLGWAKPSTDEPMLTLTQEELDIDPETIQNESGLKVADLNVKSGS